MGRRESSAGLWCHSADQCPPLHHRWVSDGLWLTHYAPLTCRGYPAFRGHLACRGLIPACRGLNLTYRGLILA